MIALVSIYKLVIHQIDVKTTFLNGDLEEEIYMSQLEGCVVDDQENKVFKLLKSLYGLKQEPKQWHEKFNETLLVDGFSSSDVDRCVYTKFVNDDHVIICLYVDDMLIFGTYKHIITWSSFIDFVYTHLSTSLLEKPLRSKVWLIFSCHCLGTFFKP